MSEQSKPAQKSFYESWMSLALMVAFIVIARVYLLEPFKIPSGSMEPTLIGHEDFGDRILTNKLAYVSGSYALLAFGAMLLLILQGLSWAVEYARNPAAVYSAPFIATIFLVALRVVKAFRFSFYQNWFDWIGLGVFGLLALYTLYWYARNFRAVLEHKRALIYAAVAALILFVGAGLAWSRNAIAGEPKRFDVAVFEYDSRWDPAARKIQDINYIKRLVGLPGDTLTVAGGDLYLFDKATGKDKIIRKWEVRGDALQDAQWFPVSKAFDPRFEEPKFDDDADKKILRQQLRDLAFPWTGAEDGAKGAKLESKKLVLDASAPVKLEYKFPVSNVYLKQGRWPFEHHGCPAANLKGITSPDGIVWRNPNSAPERIDAYVSNTWEGVQCPNCKRVYFPIKNGTYDDGTSLSGIQGSGETNFFYGGEYADGDLKIDIKLKLDTFGSLRIETGNSLRRAIWNIPGGGESDVDAGFDKGGKSHFVQKKIAALAPGEHSLTLAYVDGTVIAALDGVEIEKRPLDVEALPNALYRGAESVARISLEGCTGEITRLNLSRDLYYTHWDEGRIWPRQREYRRFDSKTGNFVFNVPENEFLMMGDNSPSSSDGRVWGFVPRERLMGRAGAVWWPPSRWREIK